MMLGVRQPQLGSKKHQLHILLFGFFARAVASDDVSMVGRVTLFDDFTTWRDRLIFAWRDFALPNVPVMIQVVDPHPAPLEHDITAHVILDATHARS